MLLTELRQEPISYLLNTKKVYSVPDYQRNYSWTLDNAKDLWNDILGVYSGYEDSHFVGPIVLLDENIRTQHSGDSRNFTIIDGQQRITTIYLLIATIRDAIAEKLDNQSVIINGISVPPATMAASAICKTGFQSPNLIANYLIEEVFMNFIFKPTDSPDRKYIDNPIHLSGITQKSKRNAKCLIANAIFFKSEISEFVMNPELKFGLEEPIRRIHKLLNVILEKLDFLQIVVPSEEDAYILFETLNDRGLRLSPSDLLKSFLMRDIISNSPNTSRESILDKWDNSVEQVSSIDFTRFLRHLILNMKEKKSGKRQLFSDFKEQVKINSEPGTTGSLKVLNRIYTSSQVYSQLLTPVLDSNNKFDSIESTYYRLNQISDSHRIYLLKVLESNLDEDRKKVAAEVVENFSFRWTICGENAQELEDHYRECLQIISDADQESLDSSLRKLLAKAPSDTSLISSFANDDASMKLRNYVLRKYTKAAHRADVPETQQIHIEHIAPKKPDANSKNWYECVALETLREEDPADRPVYDDYIDKWGNLTLLDRRINVSIRNALWSDKKGNAETEGECYFKSLQPMVKGLMPIVVWDRQVLVNRTNWFALNAPKVWQINLNPSLSTIEPFDPSKTYSL